MKKKFIKQSDLISEGISNYLEYLRETDVTNPALDSKKIARKKLQSQPVAPAPVPQAQPPAPAQMQQPQAPAEPQPEHVPGSLETGAAAHQAHFFHPNTVFNKLNRQKGGANSVFHLTSGNKQYIVKPHATINPNRLEPEQWHNMEQNPTPADWEEPEHWDARNQASNRVLDAMNMSHMGVHTFRGQVPSKQRVKTGVLDKLANIRSGHPLTGREGAPAQVSVFAGNTKRPDQATPEELSKIDAHHRLAGMVHGILTNNPDAHHGNVLINTQNNHPVHIADNDLSFASRMQRHRQSADDQKRPSVMSVYAPGESLDYRRGKMKDPETGQERELGQVGTNYPPHVLNALKLASAGKLGHGLSDADHATLVNNANDLLTHGLEGTMKRRNMIPTYKRQSELDNQPAVLPNEGVSKPPLTQKTTLVKNK